MPHRAFAKLAARLVPNQTPDEVGQLPKAAVLHSLGQQCSTCSGLRANGAWQEPFGWLAMVQSLHVLHGLQWAPPGLHCCTDRGTHPQPRFGAPSARRECDHPRPGLQGAPLHTGPAQHLQVVHVSAYRMCWHSCSITCGSPLQRTADVVAMPCACPSPALQAKDSMPNRVAAHVSQQFT